ncbi:MAG: glycine dehydrogenase [Methanobacteriota archaeon]|nr:MAG: glycine dehydrogenase [Euryarchaeota archaeon]
MPSEEDEMLHAMGLRNIDDLFTDIPTAVRIPKLDLPDGLPEDAVVSRVTSMLAANRTVVDMPTFLGGGLYDHFIPASVRAITSRSEFYTSYTPYQPELSQGMLQALWEYQSLVCELTCMDGANTSMYDGSTALGEAARIAHRILSDDVCGVYVENPNFFGRFEEQLEDIRRLTKAPFVVGVNPIAQAVVRPPGDFGADIVIGEGQPLGSHANFGGPLLGIFACRQEHIRKMPGRVIGLTRDAAGQRAFCMTLQTREQHIRREKAMSNICTNEALLAVAAASYLSVLGGNGLRRVASENIRRAKELASAIDRIEAFTAPLFNGAHFNEFVVRSQKPYASVHKSLLAKGVHGGLSLGRHLPELENAALFTTTGRHAPDAIERLLKALREVR